MKLAHIKQNKIEDKQLLKQILCRVSLCLFGTSVLLLSHFIGRSVDSVYVCSDTSKRVLPVH